MEKGLGIREGSRVRTERVNRSRRWASEYANISGRKKVGCGGIVPGDLPGWEKKEFK